MFGVNTTLGVNVEGGYVTSFFIDYQNPLNNKYDFDKTQYDLDYMGAYKLGNNELILDETKKAEIIAEKTKETELAECVELKQKLLDSDYIYNVIREGDQTEEHYADVIANRKQWRARVREIEEKYREE